MNHSTLRSIWRPAALALLASMAWTGRAAAQTATSTPPFPIHEIRGVLFSDYDHAPMAGVAIELDWQPVMAGYPRTGGPTQRAVTDDDGTFVIETWKPPEMPFRLSIRNPLLETLLLMQTPAFPSTPPEPIELRYSMPPGWIAGRLTAGDGRPITWGIVYLFSPKDPVGIGRGPVAPGQTLHQASPDANGFFVLGPVPPGQYRVLFRNDPRWFEGQLLREAVATRMMEQAADNLLNLVVVGPILELRVEDEAGQAVSAFALRSRTDDFREGSNYLDLSKGNQAGVVRLAGYGPGRYFFSAIAEDGFGVLDVDLDASSDGKLRPLTIPYRRGRGRVTGVVLGSLDRPFRRSVHIVSTLRLAGKPMSGVGLQWSVPVDEQGRFASRPLPPGEYSIGMFGVPDMNFYHAGEGDTAVSPLSEQSHGNDTEVVAAEGDKEVVIEAVDADDRPVAGATVFLTMRQSRGTGGGGRGLTDAKGRWRSTRLGMADRSPDALAVEIAHPAFSTVLTPWLPYEAGATLRFVFDPPANLRVVALPADEASSRALASALVSSPWLPRIFTGVEIPFQQAQSAGIPPVYPRGWRGEILIMRIPRGVPLTLYRTNDRWEVGEPVFSIGGSVWSRGEVFTVPREGPATEFRLDVPLRLKDSD